MIFTIGSSVFDDFEKQEHVVETNFEPAAFGTGGKHGAAIVGHHEPDGLTQARR